MSHLSAERLAALADPGRVPTPDEADHLARCGTCAGEQLAYLSLVAAAGAERSALGVPLTRWDALAGALRAEGLIAPSDGAHRPVAKAGAGPTGAVARRRLPPRFMQAAAAVAFLAAGAGAGRMSALAGPLAVDPGAAPVAAAAPSTPTADMLIPEYTSATEARAALERFEVAYQHAAAYLADHDSSTRLDASEDYRTRLVALERAGNTMREAMEKAPYDPVLTGYYLTTLGQREATLRQLNVAVPAGARLNSF